MKAELRGCLSRRAGGRAVWLLPVWICFASTRALALTVTVPVESDAWIDSALSTANHGADSALGVQASPAQRVLVRFDLSGIPACATVSSATLKLRVTQGANGKVHEVHRINVDWTEAAATWDCPDGNCPTTMPWNGGDFVAAPSDSKSEGGSGSLVKWDVTDDVTAFAADPSANHGWLIKDATETATYQQITYAAREDTMSDPPALDVTLTLDDTKCTDSVACHANSACTMMGCTFDLDDSLCDDMDPCTVDTCTGTQPNVGGCSNVAVANPCCGQADGTACDDNSDCTTDDKCHDGLCGGTIPTGCRSAEKSTLLIKNTSEDARDRLVWKWIRGGATSQTDFANPKESADYTLCVYAGTANSVITKITIPHSGFWTELDGKGFTYLDKPGSQDGVQKVLLKGNDADPKSKVLLKGQGANLPDAALAVTSVVFQPSVKAILTNQSTHICWQSDFTGTVVNTDRLLEVKTP